ncbi:MAG: ribonuclease H [Minisyncoccia bacterium]|jgi:ribonuclease HI
MGKDTDTIIIFCDGAAKGNPGPGGWGALVATHARVQELGGKVAHTTNNRMELTAAAEALTYAGKFSGKQIVMHTDSSYVINGITKWVQGWKKNGWKTKDKREVLNKNLWMQLNATVQNIAGSITWRYVGGHVGVLGNERVDAIASDFAEGKKVKLYNGPRSKYTIDITNLGRDESLHKEKSASRERSKAKAYSYVSKVGGKIATHKTWGQCEACVKGKVARYKKALSSEDEASIIKEFSSR